MPTPAKGPLSEAQLDRLADILDSRPEAMSLEMLDGFFAALICSPRLVMPNEYLPLVWGTSGFVDMAAAEEAMGLLMQLWNHRAEVLHTGEDFLPLLFEWPVAEGSDEMMANGNDWAAGFLTGADLAGEGWNDLLHDEANNSWMQPFIALALEHDPDPEIRTPTISEEDRGTLLLAMALAVEEIYEYFAPYRGLPAMSAALRQGRMPAKPGRNSPCPCGSSLKYKRCCGK